MAEIANTGFHTQIVENSGTFPIVHRRLLPLCICIRYRFFVTDKEFEQFTVQQRKDNNIYRENHGVVQTEVVDHGRQELDLHISVVEHCGEQSIAGPMALQIAQHWIEYKWRA